MDPEIWERIREALGLVRQAVDPTTPGFFDRGVPGFVKNVIQDVQRRPGTNLTPLGAVENLAVGKELTDAGHTIIGPTIGALGVADLATLGPLIPSLRQFIRPELLARGPQPHLPTPRAPETSIPLRLEHRGAPDLDVVDPARYGTGQPSAERARQAADPEGFLPRSYYNRVGERPEARFEGKPVSEVDVPEHLIATPEDWRAFVDEAVQVQAQAGAHDAGRIANIAEQLAAVQGFEAIEPTPGTLEVFTPQRVRVGATGQGVRAVQQNARSYLETTKPPGVQAPKPMTYMPVPEDQGRQIADLYEALPHDPSSPIVRESYDAFKRETLAQYRHLVDQGVKFEPVVADPYPNSAAMIDDVRTNQRIKYFLTDPNSLPADHPLAEGTGVFAGDRELVYNDLFRGVHDYFGHAAEGFQFGARGEHNAWAAHTQMYSPQARPAMSFETRGQNSWVNFNQALRRPDGSIPRKGDPDFVPPQERPFAEQKANVLPYDYSDPTELPPLERRQSGGESRGLRAGDPQAEAISAEAQGAVFQDLQARAGSVEPYHGGLDPVTALQREVTLRETLPVTRSLPQRPGSAAELADARVRRDKRNKDSRARRSADIERGLAAIPGELDAYRGARRDVRRAIEHNYSMLPDPVTFAHAAIRGSEARGWYQGSGQALQETFREDAPRFTALLAATSPQKSVQVNLEVALDLWGNWNMAGRPTDEATLREIIASVPAVLPESDTNNILRALQGDAERLATGDPTLLSGPKVGPFYANLLGAVNPVVNDTHMARGYGTLPTRVGKRGRSLAQNAMVRNAAKEFERITGHAVDPREMQEMAWAYIRGLTNAAGASGQALNAIEQSFLDPDKLLAGDLTLAARIKESASIGELLAQPQFAARLERAGVDVPTPRAPMGTPGVNPQSADINALRDIAERIDLVRSGSALYTAAPIVGLLGSRSERDRDR